MKTFKLNIVTPRGIYQQLDVQMLNLRTTAGQIGILANHLPLASGVEISEMNYIDAKGERKTFAVAGGFVYVSEDDTSLIVNAIESPEEIDLHRAEEAKLRAQRRLDSKDGDLLRASMALKKAITRISVKNQ